MALQTVAYGLLLRLDFQSDVLMQLRRQRELHPSTLHCIYGKKWTWRLITTFLYALKKASILASVSELLFVVWCAIFILIETSWKYIQYPVRLLLQQGTLPLEDSIQQLTQGDLK